MWGVNICEVVLASAESSKKKLETDGDEQKQSNKDLNWDLLPCAAEDSHGWEDGNPQQDAISKKDVHPSNPGIAN